MRSCITRGSWGGTPRDAPAVQPRPQQAAYLIKLLTLWTLRWWKGCCHVSSSQKIVPKENTSLAELAIGCTSSSCSGACAQWMQQPVVDGLPTHPKESPKRQHGRQVQAAACGRSSQGMEERQQFTSQSGRVAAPRLRTELLSSDLLSPKSPTCIRQTRHQMQECNCLLWTLPSSHLASERRIHQQIGAL